MPKVVAQNHKPVAKKTGTVIDRIRPIGFDGSRGISILLYGQSATGKTTLWSSFPAPILSMICSGGMSPGELLSVDTPANRKRIQEVTLNETTECRDIINYVKEEGTFKTLVLDHISGLQDLTLKEILGLDELPAQKSWGLATQQQWGQSTAQCKEILRAMLNLIADGTNIVIIGQERETEPKEGNTIGIPTIGVATTPSLAGWINPAVDYICQTFKRPVMVEKETALPNGKTMKTTTRGEGVQFCCRTGPHDVFTTKFRVPLGTPLPEEIVNPTYDKLMKLIRHGG